MNNIEIKNHLISELKKVGSFWSYDDVIEVPDDILIEKVLIYLDMDDTMLLFDIFSKREIKRAWQVNLLSQEPMYHNLNKFYAWLFFEIKDPDKYLKRYSNKHLYSK